MAGVPNFSALPKLPGMGFGEEFLRTDFRRRQLLNPSTGVRDSRSRPRSLLPAAISPLLSTLRTSNAPPPPSGGAPPQTPHDPVLRFQAYFVEPVPYSPLEKERVRRCVVYFHPSDGTVAVTEPRTDNSGLGGPLALVKRHTVARPDGQPYGLEDLNVGRELRIYGKTFRLVDCDDYSRRYLMGLGIDVPAPEPIPDDQYTRARQQVAASTVARKPRIGMDDGHGSPGAPRTRLTVGEIAATKRFLSHDRQVLRFHCCWDDRDTLYGDLRLFTLNYFLSDDSVEVAEDNPPNSGRDPFPSFVKRSRVPKPRPDGRFANPTAALTFKPEAAEYLTDRDLRIGVTVPIFGRDFFIYDCDAFTREYLHDKYGVTDFTPIDISQPGPARVVAPPPPHTGFGDEEDALGSCKSLVVKPPRKDVQRMLAHGDTQLKFKLRLVDVDPIHDVREFVLTIYPADNTIAIYEPAQRNTGVMGGKFLQRQRVRRAGSNGVPSAEYLQPADFHVGARIMINSWPFLVCSADDRTLQYMEAHPTDFPRSDTAGVLLSLRLLPERQEFVEAITEAAGAAGGRLSTKAFAALIERMGLPVSEQEVLTLIRRYDPEGEGQLRWSELVEALRLPPTVVAAPSDVNHPTQPLPEEAAASVGRLPLIKPLSDTIEINALAASALRLVREKYRQRPVLVAETLRVAADQTHDGRLGEAELRKVIVGRLQAAVPEQALRALTFQLFGDPPGRLTAAQLTRVFNGVSPL